MKRNLAHGSSASLTQARARRKKVILRKQYKSQKDYLKFHNYGTVAFLLLIALIIGFIGYKSELVDKVQSKMTVYAKEYSLEASKSAQLQADNSKLTIIAQVATASAKPVWLSVDQAKILISIVIPDKAAQTRFFNIISKCENGPKLVDGTLRFNPMRINQNVSKDGKTWSYDLGFAQINSYYHADQVKAMFGQDFNSAMSDPAKNIMFAAWLYDHSHNFTAWACDAKVAK